MKVLTQPVAGMTATINVVQNEDDVPAFKDFVRRHPRLAFDTEGTDLNVFSPRYRLRLVQFGHGLESWVLPVERGERYAWLAKATLEHARQIVCHNLTYDALVADRHLGVPLEALYPKGLDTGIFSRLVDSRAAHEGGTGHSLEELTAAMIDLGVADEVKGAMTRIAKRYKTTKKAIWSKVLLEDEEFLRYAGMDPVLTWLLLQRLAPKVPERSRHLIRYEHQIAYICALMERRGILLDREYTERKARELEEEQERYEKRAAELGCENVNAPKQVAEALQRFGWEPTKLTATGQPQVSKKELEKLAEEGYELAEVIQKAKRANKWNSAYFQNFLQEVDPEGRIHPSINTMQARTARMSITRPALQTLPSGDTMVRHAFLAEEGERFFSIDYKTMELRVLAARSGDEVMKRAFAEGRDLHSLTAEAAFGPGWTDKHRKIAKTVNFGRVYGGGAKTVAEQTGISLDEARRVVEEFDKAYPAVAEYSARLQKYAAQRGYIYTMTGRRQYVDPGRTYAALNYDIQSSSRDILGRALVLAHKKGLVPYMRLPVHDEIVGSAPIKEAEEITRAIAEVMKTTINGVVLETDAELGGRSWGSLPSLNE